MFCPRGVVTVGRRSRAGLTITELLLVISVLAILAAIILPALLRTRDTSYRAQCAGNLRQFAAAFLLYSQDWNGCWPCPGGLAGDWGYWAQTGDGGLQSYVRQRGMKSIWCCPLTREWNSRFPARTYSMNSYLRTPADVEYPSCVNVLRGVETRRITEPRRTILLYEGLQLTTGWETSPLHNYIYRCANWAWVRGYTGKVSCSIDPGRPWHGRLNNYLYCDGHVLARPPGRSAGGVSATGRVIPETLSTYGEMREWYVDKARYEEVFTEKWAGMIPRK